MQNMADRKLHGKVIEKLYTQYTFRTKEMSKSLRIRKINLSKVCRCCLNESGTLKDIINTKLPMMLSYCASVELLEDDGLPQQVCVLCFRMISKMYVFKKKVLRCDTLLRHCIKKRQKNKDFSDILDKAVNEAEIINQQEVITYESEDDVPLTTRQHKVDEQTVEFNRFSTVEPPPLIPLDGNLKIEDAEVMVVPKIDVTPPPLVPINTVTSDLANIKVSCLYCNEFFDSVSELKEHKLNVCKGSSNSLNCTICQKEFTDRKRLIGHLKGHMVVKEHLCKLCGKCYANNSSLQVHMRTHTGERPYKCELCNKGFVRWAGVMAHMRTHNKNKAYLCNVCGKAFSIRSNLNRHKVLHSAVLPYCCNYCGKTFSQSDNLQLHIRTYHTLEKPFLCNECGKGFVSATRLKRHMWVHTGYKPYNCSICNKAYSNSNDLKIHETSHNPSNDAAKPHVCLICNARFFHSCRLSKHMRIHLKPFVCQECEKPFSTEEAMRKHITNKHVVMMSNVPEEEEVYVEEVYSGSPELS